MGTFMPSEIARLVLGYLEEQNCMSAYDEFLKVSPYLDECRGRNFTTVLMGYSLTDILEDYSSTQAHLLSCKPDELRKELRRYRTLLDKVKILVENVHLTKLLNNYTLASSNSTKNSTQTSVESPIKKHVQKTSNAKICTDCNLLSANCGCKPHLPPILPNLFATPFKLDPTHAVELSSLPIECLVETTRLCDLPGTDNEVQKTMDKTGKDNTLIENTQVRVEDDLHLTDVTEKDMDMSDCVTNKRVDQTKSSQDLSFNLSVKTNELLNCSEKRFWEVGDTSAAENKIDKGKAPVDSPGNGSETIDDANDIHQNSKEDCVNKKDNRPDYSFDEFANGVTGGSPTCKSAPTGDTTSTPELDANVHQKKSKFINTREPDVESLNEIHPINSVNALTGSIVEVDGTINNHITNPPRCELYENPLIASENSIHYVKPSLKGDVNSKIYSVNVPQTSNTDSSSQLRQGPESSSQLRQGPESSSQLRQGPESSSQLRQGPESSSQLRQGPESSSQLRQGPASSSQFLPFMATISRHDPKPSCSWTPCIDAHRSTTLNPQDRPKGNDRNVIILSNDIVDTNILNNEIKLVINKRLDSKPETNKAGVNSTITSQLLASSLMYTAPMCASHPAASTEYVNVSYAQTVPITVTAAMTNVTTVKQDALVTREIKVAPRNIFSGKVPDVFISNGIMQIAPITRSSSQSKIFSEADIMSMPTVIMLNPTEAPAVSTDLSQMNVPVLSLPETSEIRILDDGLNINEKTVHNLADQNTASECWQSMPLMYNIDNTSNDQGNENAGITMQASSISQNDIDNAMTPQSTIQTIKSSSTPRRQHPHVRVLDFKSPPRHTSEIENVTMPASETNCNSEVEGETLTFDHKENKVRTKLSTQYEACSLQKRGTLESCEIQTNVSKNQFIPSVDDSKLQADLQSWKEMGVKKNSWDQDLRALLAKQTDEGSSGKLKTKNTKKPKIKKKVKEKTVKRVVRKYTEDNSLDNSLEKNGKLLEEILELDNEKKPRQKSKDTVTGNRKQAKCRLVNKKPDATKRKTSEKPQECNKTISVKEVILDNSIAAMKVNIIKPVFKVKAEQRSSKCNVQNELDSEPPVPSIQTTPDMLREDVTNPINAKCNLASLLETPLKMSMMDIPMQTPRFISPGQIFAPTSDIKILTIPTPNFLQSPKTTLINKITSNSKAVSPYTRLTDYSSGSSYYRPDENECTIDFTDIQSDAQDPLILTEKDYEQQSKPGSEGSAGKLFSCQNIIHEAKAIRPRRQCTLKVQCYNENTKFSQFSKPGFDINKISKGNTEKFLKKVVTKKERTEETSSPECALESFSNDSLLSEDVESEGLERVSPKAFNTDNSANQINSKVSLQVEIKQGTEPSPSKINNVFDYGARKPIKLSIKKRDIKTINPSKTKISKSKTRNSKPLMSRKHIKSLAAPKLSGRHVPKTTCSSCDHLETKPLPTKSRRKSSTPRKLEAISFKEEGNQRETSGPPVVNKFIHNEHINAEEELPSLHFSSDEADTNVENVGGESEKHDDPFISEIREFIKSSDKTNISTLVDYPKKNSNDLETAKLIERDLLGSPNAKKGYSLPVLKKNQQSDAFVKHVEPVIKHVEYAIQSPTLASSNCQTTSSHILSEQSSVSKLSGKDNADTRQVNDTPLLNKIENSPTNIECDSAKPLINENQSLFVASEIAVCESSPSEDRQNENTEAVVEWSISESNADTENFIKICDLSIRDRSTLHRSHIDMSSFLRDICVYNTENEEEEDRKLNISPMVQLFTIDPKKDYSRSKRNLKKPGLNKPNQVETLGHSRESEYSKEMDGKSLEPNKELYDHSETELAVQSIMGIDKLYTPNKNQSTLSKRCLELFGDTASNISSPDKDDVRKDVEITVCTVEGHKELDRSELEEGEYVSENESEACLGDFDASRASDNRKRKVEFEPDGSESGAKKSKDIHTPHILLKGFDIECILSKLHGPK